MMRGLLSLAGVRGTAAIDGFTLLELVAVLGIVAALSAVMIGLMAGAKGQASVARARGELAVLAQAVEAYRARYGAYPQAESPAEFRAALLGRRNAQGEPVADRPLLEEGRLTLRDPDLPEAAANSWIDPWGREYQYVPYARATGRASPEQGYVLCSWGERGRDERVPTTTEWVPERTGERAGVVAVTPLQAPNLYAQP